MPFDHSLPTGIARPVIHAVGAYPAVLMLMGRLASIVRSDQEQFLVLESVPDSEFDKAFQDTVDFLLSAQGKIESYDMRSTNSWAIPASDIAPAQIFVHLTNKTYLTTFAWKTDHSWLEDAAFRSPTLEIGAIGVCTTRALQVLGGGPVVIGQRPVLSTTWVLKATYIARMQRAHSVTIPSCPRLARYLRTQILPDDDHAADELPNVDLPATWKHYAAM
uniref:Uncharacterized protein n=1 Tax=Mycena chlorophos TaxID=658473 RepID=A0ABQ0KZE7_MYCCL|nr:predicted protein [Mycena chlorophos]